MTAFLWRSYTGCINKIRTERRNAAGFLKSCRNPSDMRLSGTGKKE
jgi:hypothetical protein